MSEQPASTPPTAPPTPRGPSPLRVAAFVVMLAIVLVSVVTSLRAPENDVTKRLDAHYYAFMGDFLTRTMVGLESLEAEGAMPSWGASPDEFAQVAAENYELALERREDDLGLRIALAAVYWHAGLRAEQQMLDDERAGRPEAAQEREAEAGRLKTKAVNALHRGLSLRPGDSTITTLVYGLVSRAHVKPEWLEDAELRRIAADIAPGHLMMCHLYADAGMREPAAAELEQAYDDGWRTVVRMMVAGVGRAWAWRPAW